MLIEAADIPAAMESLASSENPFDPWFREHITDTHGMDLAEGFTPPEQVIDCRG